MYSPQHGILYSNIANIAAILLKYSKFLCCINHNLKNININLKL